MDFNSIPIGLSGLPIVRFPAAISKRTGASPAQTGNLPQQCCKLPLDSGGRQITATIDHVFFIFFFFFLLFSVSLLIFYKNL